MTRLTRKQLLRRGAIGAAALAVLPAGSGRAAAQIGAPVIASLSQVFSVNGDPGTTEIVDNGDEKGFGHFTAPLPPGAIPIAVEWDVQVAFAGGSMDAGVSISADDGSGNGFAAGGTNSHLSSVKKFASTIIQDDGDNDSTCSVTAYFHDFVSGVGPGDWGNYTNGRVGITIFYFVAA